MAKQQRASYVRWLVAKVGQLLERSIEIDYRILCVQVTRVLLDADCCANKAWRRFGYQLLH